ncbi:MerR family transcriptional regulator [Shewanella avicenniae]|uniref:MerR family transcriptional regulator n=1 Tax=Shewanella avicenniae TaxID=2814294 RepID=A0ABX7QQL1_9GAMM|nr:MerR family transcriptional regulator [Shewanella avicenniae]QSX32976.1 MerR family transcriptional regulator [Shewanella avicenniae]
MYSIGEVSNMFQLTVPTLRYYDQQGLFPNLKRSESGVRSFCQNDLESIRVIEYLKKAGMSLKDIRTFIDWCHEGDDTLIERRNMFVDKLAVVQAEIAELNRVQDLLKFKAWYYTQAVAENTEARMKHIQPQDMPEEIRKAYENSHAELECPQAHVKN